MYYCINCTYYNAIGKCGVRHIFIGDPATMCCEYFKKRDKSLVSVDFKAIKKSRDKKG